MSAQPAAVRPQTVCSNMPHDLNSFEVLKQFKSDFQAKIHEALLIK